jgi:hypothetical protein
MMNRVFGLVAGVGIGLLFGQTCRLTPSDPHAGMTSQAATVTPVSAPAAAPAPKDPAPAAAAETPDALFARTVRPILAERCAPCHNPGGQMYAKLPFDDPKTVADHRGGIVKRIKGEERKTLDAWLAVVPASTSPVHY